MKKVYLLVILCVIATYLHAQTVAITPEGRRVILLQNGSWRYTDSSFSNYTYNVNSLYAEAYDYAYEVLYGDEFFTSERRNKSVEFAVDYVKDNLSIGIGYKTLEQWYDELYSFAYDHLAKGTWAFNPDRRKVAIDWASQTIKDKGYFDDYRISLISRRRMAYNFAYNRVYANEMFAQDRRKKALDW